MSLMEFSPISIRKEEVHDNYRIDLWWVHYIRAIFKNNIDVITTGGQAKWYLQEYTVFVDGELENRRGRKLYPNTRVEIPDEGIFYCERKWNRMKNDLNTHDAWSWLIYNYKTFVIMNLSN